MSMKNAYEKKLKSQLDQWTAEIDRLKAKAKESEADAQLEYDKEIKELRHLQENASRKLEELKSSSDAAWEDIKAGTESAWDTLSQAVQSAKKRFR